MHPLARTDMHREDLLSLVWSMTLALARHNGHPPHVEALHWGLIPTARTKGGRPWPSSTVK